MLQENNFALFAKPSRSAFPGCYLEADMTQPPSLRAADEAARRAHEELGKIRP